MWDPLASLLPSRLLAPRELPDPQQGFIDIAMILLGLQVACCQSSKTVFWNLTLTSSLRVSASWNIKWWLSGSGKTKGDRRKWSKRSKTGEAIHQDDWFHIPLLKGDSNHCCNSKEIKLGNTSAPDIPHRFLFYGANLRLAETTSEQVPVIQILKQRDKDKAIWNELSSNQIHSSIPVSQINFQNIPPGTSHTASWWTLTNQTGMSNFHSPGN